MNVDGSETNNSRKIWKECVDIQDSDTDSTESGCNLINNLSDFLNGNLKGPYHGSVKLLIEFLEPLRVW